LREEPACDRCCEEIDNRWNPLSLEVSAFRACVLGGIDYNSQATNKGRLLSWMDVMIKCYETGIEVIKDAFAGAAKGLICTPYYSERGLRLLDPFFDGAEEVEFWTRFSPLDWRAGVADMAALKQRVQSVQDREKKFDIRVSDDLHAKIYGISDEKVIIGSANLTWPGMTSNIETICELSEEEAVAFLSFLPTIKNKLTPMAARVFVDYVDVAADAVSKSSDGPAEEDEEMNAAIDLAEEALRQSLTNTAPEARGVPPLDIAQFLDYCRQDNTDISEEVLARHEGKHNLQGHVKHCFYGCVRFLSEHKELVDEIAATPGELLYDFSNTSARSLWRDFLREHANEIDKERGFSFRTLRVYLPDKFGGICTGGGGGSSTLKRIFPVVARMIRG